MTEIGEPIETNDFQLAKEVLITYWDDKKVMYDLNGNETFTCGYYAEDLFGNIVGNPDDIIENPNETKDYKNTIDYKKTPQKVIAGFV